MAPHSKEPLNFPDDFFIPLPDRNYEVWPDNAELRKAVEWFKTFMTDEEWSSRRLAIAHRFYDASLGQIEESDKGRFFSEEDTFGWYLFLGEALIDHLWNYDPTFGSRVIPVFTAIGRNLDSLKNVPGLEERVRRLVSPERSQPNGGLFEILVAAAYMRAGGEVAFTPEQPGQKRTHDMDVTINGINYAVECKRMESGDYNERERARMRQLWRSSAQGLTQIERSTFCKIRFLIPLNDVPDDYLLSKTREWLSSKLTSLLWSDEISFGIIGELDLNPLQALLATDDVLTTGSRMHELLTGRYVRNASYIQALRVKRADGRPRYVSECDLAVLLQWESVSDIAIDAKARDIFRKLVEANDQLPTDKPGIVHIGFEALNSDVIERARYEKILMSASRFDPANKPLEYVYCHSFAPESPPDETWAFDETTHWIGIHSTHAPPLSDFSLVLPPEAPYRKGAHWDGGQT